MRLPVTAALVVAAALVAGCGQHPHGGADPDAAWAALEQALDLPAGHNHTDAAQHPGQGWDLRELAYVQAPAAAPGSLGQFVVVGHHAFLSLNRGGLVVLDVSIPGQPREVGVLEIGNAYTNDIEVTPDLRWAILPNSQPPGLALLDLVSNATAMRPLAEGGFFIVDLADLRAPRLAATVPSLSPEGYHRADLLDIDGALYVFAASYLLTPASCHVDIFRFDAQAPTLHWVSRYQSPVLEDRCVPLSTVADPEGGKFPHGVHEVFVAPDPLEGFPLLVVAHWTAGVLLADVSDPERPRHLGRWDTMPGFQDTVPNVHEAQVTGVEGRRIVAATPEHFGSERQGLLWLVDWTDLAAPHLVGTWQIPGVHPYGRNDNITGDIQSMSTDAPVIVDGHVWLVHHHAGLFVLDIQTMDKVRKPELVAWIMPPGAPELARFGNWLSTPLVYDAEVGPAGVFAVDINAGFRALSWDPGLGAWSAAPATS